MKIKEVNIKKIAEHCIENVFRTNTNSPGFVYLDFGENRTSSELRAIMVALKNELSVFTLRRFNKELSYHWLVRFDQQVSTPFHLDNAEDQSFLMLGYEPSAIESELYIADYYKYANDHKEASEEYLKNFTPVFKEDEAILTPYITKLASFDKHTYKIVLINNSNPKQGRETLGVFHKAKIVKPDLNKSRTVNSMIFNMLSKDNNIEDQKKEHAFLNTDIISK
ncbi:hypothetical protein BTO15_13565 [Polaribacter sejongensis]|uniref:Uncharacterized protein n=1 Tax=Polaribacter sejongensis TaxID=985043 RepID=A0ABN5F6F9_9FLAO|nr:hypothetical protein [Polaribacter sejongensis]AUC23057.1 hypothetical protein BTO15_13565 [Polaribacter sejongensis]